MTNLLKRRPRHKVGVDITGLVQYRDVEILRSCTQLQVGRPHYNDRCVAVHHLEQIGQMDATGLSCGT